MPCAITEPLFRLDIANLFRGLPVLSFSGRQAVSEPFAFELEVLVDSPGLDPHSLMYRTAFLAFKGRAVGIHGQIQGVQRSHFRPGPVCYQLTLGPRLACLGQRYTPRIFQQMTAPQIIRQVLLEHGIRDDSFRFDFKAECPVREYCAQYRESDLQLLQRLCAEEGLHYHFQHSPRDHLLVFGDGLRGLRRMSTANFQIAPRQAGVTRFWVNKVTSNRAGRRSLQRAEGESTLPFIAAGHLLPLKGHPQAEWNRLWLVTEVEHRGFDLRQSGSSAGREAALYLNRFQAMSWEVGFKPDPVSRAMPQWQLARVLGPLGEVVEGDAQGRLPAQFDWGAQAWLPVDPALVDTLRGGTRVAVSFIQGDAGRPLIGARLWHPEVDEADPLAPTGHVQVRLGLPTVVGDDPCILLPGGPLIACHGDSELSLRVGDSTLRIDAGGATLSSRQILFAAGDDTA
jgi:type VI secretion system secreted protein VgrG